MRAWRLRSSEYWRSRDHYPSGASASAGAGAHGVGGYADSGGDVGHCPRPARCPLPALRRHCLENLYGRGKLGASDLEYACVEFLELLGPQVRGAGAVQGRGGAGRGGAGCGCGVLAYVGRTCWWGRGARQCGALRVRCGPRLTLRQLLRSSSCTSQ